MKEPPACMQLGRIAARAISIRVQVILEVLLLAVANFGFADQGYRDDEE